MNSVLENAILVQLALHYPEPMEALVMFVPITRIHNATETCADSLGRLMDAGLVTLTTRLGWPGYLVLTNQGLEYAQQLMKEALHMMVVVSHAGEA